MSRNASLALAGAISLAGLSVLFCVFGIGALGLPTAVGCIIAAGLFTYYQCEGPLRYENQVRSEAQQRQRERLEEVEEVFDDIATGMLGQDSTVDHSGERHYHHPAERCEGEACPLHNPSDHHMRDWPLMFRYDRPPLIERICEHGIGHPDPDSLAHLERIDPNDRGAWSVHGCDACCSARYVEPLDASEVVDSPEVEIAVPEIGNVFSVPPTPDEPEPEQEPDAT